jgi:O-antigen/teichoic acid export membrane protein
MIQDLKAKTIRGGAVRAVALASGTVLRIVSVAVLSRLLEPPDVGLVGMVTAFTGILGLFRDFGLSAVAVQRTTVTEAQSSTLFWINVLTGLALTLITVVLAPVVATFYHEPRLFWITSIMSIGFLINGIGVQHSALLQRQMRFTVLAVIDIASLAVSTVIAVVAAASGLSYWALVLMSVCLPLVSVIGLWLATRWVPGWPRKDVGIGSMMRFGGALTLNGVVIYIGSNLDKVLLGRFWGSEAIGIYGRAYQLVRIPIDNLNSVIGEVAFSALSRVNDDPVRLKRYFLRGYALVLAVTVPITIACGLFAEDVIYVLLGSRWQSAAPLFRLLAPTILAFAILNPLGWLLNSLGLVGRGLKIALVLAPVMTGGYLVGLSGGPKGVALAYSTVMVLSVLPLVFWAVHGTVISFWDIGNVVGRPLLSAVAAAVVTFAVRGLYAHACSPLPRLVLDNSVLLISYCLLLLLVAGQKQLFVDVLQNLKPSPPVEDGESLTSA